MFDREKLLKGITDSLYNNPDCSKEDVVSKFVFAVKKAFGTDAVGVRLCEGRDFPYYTTIGFSESFVKVEQYLCPHSLVGMRGENWPKDTCLECVCGSVAMGTFNYGIGNMSDRGSFWTSNASREASGLPPDKAGNLRGTCLQDGYESVCIVRVMWGDRVIGLLQANDRRKGVFDEDSVAMIDSLCACLGEVLGPIIEQDMKEADRDKAFLENLLSMTNDLRRRIGSI